MVKRPASFVTTIIREAAAADVQGALALALVEQESTFRRHLDSEAALMASIRLERVANPCRRAEPSRAKPLRRRELAQGP